MNKTTSKTDLLTVLKELGRHYPQEVIDLRQKQQKADSEVKKFLKNNKEYQKLRRVAELLSETVWDTEHKERELRNNDLQKARNSIRLNGVTDETIAEVKALVKKYS